MFVGYFKLAAEATGVAGAAGAAGEAREARRDEELATMLRRGIGRNRGNHAIKEDL